MESTSKAFSTEFVVIGKEKDSFIESYIGEDIDGTNLGDFFVTLEILNRYSDGEDIGEALTEAFRKSFYQVTDTDDYTRFEEALKAVNDMARSLEEDEGLTLGNMNVAIGAIVDTTLYLSQSNDAEIYLVRKGYVSNISEGLSAGGRRKPGADLFENVATGDLERGDMIMFSSTRLFRYMSQSELGRLMYSKGINESLEGLEDALRTEVLGRIGVIGLEYIGAEPSLEEIEENVEKQKRSFKFSGVGGVKRLLGAIGGSIGSFVSGRKISLSEDMRKKVSLGLIVGFIVLFLAVYFLLTRGVISPDVQQGRDTLTQASTIVDSAKSEVNKERARELLLSAESQANNVMQERSLRSEASRLIQDIQDVRFTLDDVVSVTEPTLVAEVGGANLIGMKRLVDSLYVYTNEQVYEVIAGVVKEPAVILETGKLISAAAFDDVEAMVFYLSDGKVKEYADGIVELMDSAAESFNAASYIQTYGSRL